LKHERQHDESHASLLQGFHDTFELTETQEDEGRAQKNYDDEDEFPHWRGLYTDEISLRAPRTGKAAKNTFRGHLGWDLTSAPFAATRWLK
jgi:hypothetical protein